MFNLNDYEDVDTRIHKFYETYPDGAILTELITNDDEKGIAIFKAIAYRTHVDSAASAIGYARGARKDRGVDRDFSLNFLISSTIFITAPPTIPNLLPSSVFNQLGTVAVAPPTIPPT